MLCEELRSGCDDDRDRNARKQNLEMRSHGLGEQGEAGGRRCVRHEKLSDLGTYKADAKMRRGAGSCTSAKTVCQMFWSNWYACSAELERAEHLFLAGRLWAKPRECVHTSTRMMLIPASTASNTTTFWRNPSGFVRAKPWLPHHTPAPRIGKARAAANAVSTVTNP